MTRQTGDGAIVAKLADSTPVDTGEVRALTIAAGYEVRGEVTQVRSEDAGTYFGRGKVAELAADVAETGASLVAVDGGLSPRQTIAIRTELPDGTRVFDRYRLVLSIFGEQASTRRAQLQVELARLRYELPRIEETADAQLMNVAQEKGTRVDGVKNRIADLERKLAEMPSPAAQFRDRRREQGFDLVTLAGYTNAGKSTVLHRLADDLKLADHGRDHRDTDTTAAIEDRLFKTLETTTRRATLADRPALVTDTVGFVADLPHWLVESFSETLSEAAAADAVVLVADASDPVEEFREKLRVSLDVLESQSVEEGSIVTALNKVDLLDDDERRARLDVAGAVAPAPFTISALEDENLGRLVERVADRLPTDRAELELPNCDETMALLSRAYDRAAVETVDYEDDLVNIAVRGRPETVAKLRADAEAIAID